MCFIDFEKAFDTVSHKKLCQEVMKMGFAPHLISLVKSLYKSQVSDRQTRRVK